jgi:hypothetical protein
MSGPTADELVTWSAEVINGGSSRGSSRLRTAAAGGISGAGALLVEAMAVLTKADLQREVEAAASALHVAPLAERVKGRAVGQVIVEADAVSWNVSDDWLYKHLVEYTWREAVYDAFDREVAPPCRFPGTSTPAREAARRAIYAYEGHAQASELPALRLLVVGAAAALACVDVDLGAMPRWSVDLSLLHASIAEPHRPFLRHAVGAEERRPDDDRGQELVLLPADEVEPLASEIGAQLGALYGAMRETLPAESRELIPAGLPPPAVHQKYFSLMIGREACIAVEERCAAAGISLIEQPTGPGNAVRNREWVDGWRATSRFIQELTSAASHADSDMQGAAQRHLNSIINQLTHPPMQYQPTFGSLSAIFSWLARPRLSRAERLMVSVGHRLTPAKVRRSGEQPVFWLRRLMAVQLILGVSCAAVIVRGHQPAGLALAVALLVTDLADGRITWYTPGYRHRLSTMHSCLLGHLMSTLVLLALALRGAGSGQEGESEVLVALIVASLLMTILRIAFIGPSARGSGFALLEIWCRWIALVVGLVAEVWLDGSAIVTATVVLTVALVAELWRVRKGARNSVAPAPGAEHLDFEKWASSMTPDAP